MRLTMYTDYALRLLMYLALKPGEIATIRDVAHAYGIPFNHLNKVAHELGRAGFIETLRGRGGGLRIEGNASAIRVGDVVRSTEDDFRLVECFDPARNSCRITGSCRLRGVLHEALEAYLAVLDRFTVADLAAPDTSLKEILGIPAVSR
ncbi:Rrf2 family transcriptional regulator [Aurantimonas sp. A2-1-M11]|uniref:Rrf2 family transcriptional regulator n=1 Tax=Aurantimonas sp. A2-1-M11 TaxID=3113712 RepID=UPI002F9496C2